MFDGKGGFPRLFEILSGNFEFHFHYFQKMAPNKRPKMERQNNTGKILNVIIP